MGAGYRRKCRQNARAELEGEREACFNKRIADSQSRRVLVNLNTRGVSFQPDDLTNEAVPAHTNDFKHFGAAHVLRDDQRARDLHHCADWVCHCATTEAERLRPAISKSVGGLLSRGLNLELE